MKKDISCVFEGIDNTGAIYISGIHAAENITLLKQKGIQAVLTVAKGGHLAHSSDNVPHYLYIPAEDHEAYDISQFFSSAFEFIQKTRRDTNVLIHCMAGISRSATVAAAYLMMKFGYQMDTVLNLLQRKRKQISPNPGFLRQLSQITPKARTVSNSVQLKQKDHSKTSLQCSKNISCSIQKSNQQAPILVMSKYISSYQENRTPVRGRNSTKPVLQSKDSNKREKIQMKIDRVKQSLFSMGFQVPDSGENYLQASLNA